MEMQLKSDEDFAHGVKRLMTGQCEYVLDLLAQEDADPHETVHELRKSGKKIRSALRLIRDHIGYYKEENVFFRDLMRNISDVRDAKANIETLDKLQAMHESQLASNSFRSIREYLQDALREQETMAFEENNILAHIQEALTRKAAEIEEWPLNIRSYEPVTKGIRRVYRRGIKAFKISGKTRDTKDLHQWRKRIKYLRYQMDILNRIWPAYMTTMENELHDVSDWTGFDHDLYNLSCSVDQCEEAFDSPAQKRLFYALLNHERGAFQQLALLKGGRFYIDSPGDFSHKIGVFWKRQKEEIHSEYPTIPDIVAS